jgi:hypothetical protein
MSGSCTENLSQKELLSLTIALMGVALPARSETANAEILLANPLPFPPALLLLGVIFPLILILLFRGTLRQWQNRRLSREHPNEPWRHRVEWRDGVIRSSDKKALFLAGIFAVVFGVVSVLLVPEFRTLMAQEGEQWKALLMLLVPITAICAAVALLYLSLRHFKYGATTLQMVTMPGVLGGELRALVRVPSRIEAEEGIHATLTCVHVHVDPTAHLDRDTTRRERREILWQDSYPVPPRAIALAAGQTTVPVRFTLPVGQPQSYEHPKQKYRHDRIEWKLEVQAKTPGIDFKTAFHVPVFRTTERNPGTVFNTPEADKDNFSVSQETLIDPAIVRIENQPNGVRRFYYPAARHMPMLLTGIVLGLLVAGIGAAVMQWTDHGTVGMVTATFGLLFSGIVLYSLIGDIEVLINRYGIRYTAGIPKLRRSREIMRKDIQEIDIEKGMGTEKKQYYKIVITLKDGKKLNAGSLIPNQRMAEGITREMIRSLTA